MSDRQDRLLERAEHLYQIDQIDGAIDALREALTIDPDDASAHAWLAACLLRRRRVHAASIEAGMALTLEPSLPVGHWVAAEVSIARRDFRGAERHIDWLLESAPEEPAFHLLRARWMSLTGRGRERLPVLEAALERAPADPTALAAIAEYHVETGQLARAREYARSALGHSPESPDALLAMGRVALAAGDSAEAREHALSALRADPQSPSALALLTAVKARESALLGLWWRYASWAERVGQTRNVIVLLVAFVIYRVFVIAASDAGATGLAAGVQIAWLALVVYSFAGPTIFRRALKKELDSVRLGRF